MQFNQPDTIVPDLYNPQSLNRYAYALNNPIRFNDPSGHKCNPEDECETPHGDPGGGRGSNSGDDSKDPNEDMKTSDAGKDFIKWWEMGNQYPRQYPYEDDMSGTCTIGWGHAYYTGGNGCPKRLKDWYAAHPLPAIGPEGTESAQSLLEGDLKAFENLINKTITVDLTQAQFDALVSYTFNSSDQSNSPYFEKGIPELINSGHFEEAAAAMASGPRTSGGLESDKLIERRQAESDLFLYGTYGDYVPWKPPQP